MAIWLASQPLVLASRSDIRGKILAAVGLRFEIRPSQIDERTVEAKSGVVDAAGVAQHLARAKAEAVAAELIKVRPFAPAADYKTLRIYRKRA